jgi:Gram-negative bacterial TonB protein C-terminal
MSMFPVRLLLASVAIGCVAGVTWSVFGSVSLLGGAAVSAMSVPEDGAVTTGRYTNTYFDLSFVVPERLTAGLAGPEPSETGYYALTSLVPVDESGGAILIAAQDKFFAPKPHDNIAAEAGDFRNAMAGIDGMTIDQEPSEANIAGHLMQRIDFSGVGLYRATFVTEIRCHFVSFNLTARSPELLANLARSLSNLSAAADAAASPSVPLCVRDYAVAENILQRVEPAVIGPRFTSIPVRIVIDQEGGVKHIHVIHASDEQRRSLEEALQRWKFKPPRVDGRAVEIETGLIFHFTSEQKS